MVAVRLKSVIFSRARATDQHIGIVGAGFTNNLWEKQTVEINPPRAMCFAFMGKRY
jgi:hypothetical protein